MMRRIVGVCAPFALLACTVAEADEDYTPEQLANARAAIPSAQRLESGVPTPSNTPGALTLEGDSELGALSIAAATEINLPAAWIVGVLEQIITLSPTVYDSTTREFLWGPWNNDDGVGKVLVYVRENDDSRDFAYSYAFARTMDGDLSKVAPVIWGGATPDHSAPDLGVGVTLWDMDANNAFDAANDPAFDSSTRTEQGKVVMLYGHTQEADREVLYNMAVLRDFRGDDGEPGEPIDSEYLYGRVTDGDQTLHFLDWQFDYDVCDASLDCWDDQTVADADEQFSLRAAFVGVAGRGEATVSDGDLSAPIQITECWDGLLTTTSFSVNDGTQTVSEGTCDGALAGSLGDSGVPTLDDVDVELLAVMTCVAEQGVEACE